MTSPDELQIPEATIARLPDYRHALEALQQAGTTHVSSSDLAELAGVQSALLRRDLSWFGSYGTRGIGYEVAVLLREIGEILGSGSSWPVVIVGVGNLGTALSTHRELLQRDFSLVALLDVDPALVGTMVGGTLVQHVDELDEVVAQTSPRIAIVTTPPEVAQSVVDRLAAAGLRSILNFASGAVSAPAGVTVRTVDLSRELNILAFHETRRTSARVPKVPTTAQERDQ